MMYVLRIPYQLTKHTTNAFLEVFYGPRSLVFPEADNRKWTIMAMFECVTASSLRRLVLIIPPVYFLESGISMLKESAGKFGIPSVSKSHTKRVDCSSFAASFRPSRAWCASYAFTESICYCMQQPEVLRSYLVLTS